MADLADQEEILLTREGYELKRKQLEDYRRLLHEEIPQQLKAAKAHDVQLQENQEYLELQSQRDYYRREVRRLEDLLARATLLDGEQVSAETVAIGTRVTLQDLQRDKQVVFELVSPAEADLEADKISTDSPLGRALLGQPPGAEIEFETPAGKVQYKLLGIQRS